MREILIHFCFGSVCRSAAVWPIEDAFAGCVWNNVGGEEEEEEAINQIESLGEEGGRREEIVMPLALRRR